MKYQPHCPKCSWITQKVVPLERVGYLMRCERCDQGYRTLCPECGKGIQKVERYSHLDSCSDCAANKLKQTNAKARKQRT